MTHCAKCGAELIGSRKFCAACGTPAGDPRSPAASTGLAPVMSNRGLGGPGTPVAPASAPGSNPSNAGIAGNAGNAGSSPSIQYAPPPPVSQVNPFAQTANPITHRQHPAPDYGPPPSIPAELGSTTKGVGEPAPPPAYAPAYAPAPAPPYAPAPAPAPAASAPQVSPLAISNVSSQRGAFENAVTSGPASTAAVAAGLVGVITHPENEPSASGAKRSPVAGTQMMPSSANPGAMLSGTPSGGAPSAAGAGAASKRQDRTQLLGAFPPGTVPRPGAPAPAPGSAPSGVGAPGGAASAGSAPPGAQSAGSMQAADPQRISSVPHLPAAHAPPPPVQQPPQQTAPIQPAIPMQPPQPAQPPQQPVPPPQAPAQMQPPGAWTPAAVSFPVGQPSPALPYGGAPLPYAQPPMAPQPMPPQPMAPAPPQPAPYGYGFAYVPGSRVTVTWSNGGRYPATVQQVSGTQCLVVFPDGQQHWVEMQYVAPA